MNGDILKNLVVCDPKIGIENIDGSRIGIDGNDFLFSLVNIPIEQHITGLDDNSVVVKIKAFSCNYRDKGILLHFLRQCQKSNEQFYSFFGSDFVGEVIRVGRYVNSFKVGDRVMPDNSYPRKIDNKFGGIITNTASKRIHVFNEAELIKVPDSMPDVEAAAFPLSAITAQSIVKKANLKKGDKVLVTSFFSNTSLSCLEILKEKTDVEIYVLTTHLEDALQFAGQFNIKQAYEPIDFTLNNNLIGVFDVLIDPFVDLHINYLSRFLNYNSRYISCGINSQYTSINFREVLFNFIKTNSIFIGNCLGTREDLEDIINNYNSNTYTTRIDSVYSGDQISMFINKTFNETHFGKVVYLY